MEALELEDRGLWEPLGPVKPATLDRKSVV